jgi:hypothetical protein
MQVQRLAGICTGFLVHAAPQHRLIEVRPLISTIPVESTMAQAGAGQATLLRGTVTGTGVDTPSETVTVVEEVPGASDGRLRLMETTFPVTVAFTLAFPGNALYVPEPPEAVTLWIVVQSSVPTVRG